MITTIQICDKSEHPFSKGKIRKSNWNYGTGRRSNFKLRNLNYKVMVKFKLLNLKWKVHAWRKIQS